MRLTELLEGDVITYDQFTKRKARAALPDRRSERQKYDDAYIKQQNKSFSPEQEYDVNDDCPWCGDSNSDCDCLEKRLNSDFDDVFDISSTEWTPTNDGGAIGVKQIKDDEGLMASIDLKIFGGEEIYIENLFLFGHKRFARKLINALILEWPHKRIFISKLKDHDKAKFFMKNYHMSDEGELNVMESLVEGSKMAWARKGKTIVRKFRCTSGRRKGRIVSKPGQCSAAINLKKRASFRRTKARLGNKMARKAKKTKRINPASRRLKNLNKRR